MEENNKAIDVIGVVVTSLIAVFGLSFLLKSGFEDAAKVERPPLRR